MCSRSIGTLRWSWLNLGEVMIFSTIVAIRSCEAYIFASLSRYFPNPRESRIAYVVHNLLVSLWAVLYQRSIDSRYASQGIFLFAWVWTGFAVYFFMWIYAFASRQPLVWSPNHGERSLLSTPPGANVWRWLELRKFSVPSFPACVTNDIYLAVRLYACCGTNLRWTKSDEWLVLVPAITS